VPNIVPVDVLNIVHRVVPRDVPADVPDIVPGDVPRIVPVVAAVSSFGLFKMCLIVEVAPILIDLVNSFLVNFAGINSVVHGMMLELNQELGFDRLVTTKLTKNLV
jgi:hypothetical protein